MRQQPDYEAGVNCLLRRLFFIHALKACLRIKALISSTPPKPVTLADIPNIKPCEEASVVAGEFEEELLGEGGFGKEVKIGDIYSALYRSIRRDFWFI